MAAAHRLLGQIQEMQQQPALAAYKRSLELDSSQNDVLLKGSICKLFLPCLMTGIVIKLLLANVVLIFS